MNAIQIRCAWAMAPMVALLSALSSLPGIVDRAAPSASGTAQGNGFEPEEWDALSGAPDEERVWQANWQTTPRGMGLTWYGVFESGAGREAGREAGLDAGMRRLGHSGASGRDAPATGPHQFEPTAALSLALMRQPAGPEPDALGVTRDLAGLGGVVAAGPGGRAPSSVPWSGFPSLAWASGMPAAVGKPGSTTLGAGHGPLPDSPRSASDLAAMPPDQSDAATTLSEVASTAAPGSSAQVGTELAGAHPPAVPPDFDSPWASAAMPGTGDPPVQPSPLAQIDRPAMAAMLAAARRHLGAGLADMASIDPTVASSAEPGDGLAVQDWRSAVLSSGPSTGAVPGSASGGLPEAVLAWAGDGHGGLPADLAPEYRALFETIGRQGERPDDAQDRLLELNGPVADIGRTVAGDIAKPGPGAGPASVALLDDRGLDATLSRIADVADRSAFVALHEPEGVAWLALVLLVVAVGRRQGAPISPARSGSRPRAGTSAGRTLPLAAPTTPARGSHRC